MVSAYLELHSVLDNVWYNGLDGRLIACLFTGVCVILLGLRAKVRSGSRLLVLLADPAALGTPNPSQSSLPERTAPMA